AKRPRDATVISWDIGRTLYFSGNYPEALMTLQKVLPDAESIGENAVEAMCHDLLGRTQAAMNEQADALRHFEIALNLYTKSGNPMEAARVRALMGQTNEAAGRLDQAREFYQQALQSFDVLSDRVNQSATLFALG